MAHDSGDSDDDSDYDEGSNSVRIFKISGSIYRKEEAVGVSREHTIWEEEQTHSR